MRNVVAVLSFLLLVSTVSVSAGDGERKPLRPGGKALASNPDLSAEKDGGPKDWLLYRPAGGMTATWGDYGIGGGKGIRFAPPRKPVAPLRPAGVSRPLRKFTAGETIEVTAWLRLDEFRGTCVVWARCDSESGMQRYDGSFLNSDLLGYRLAGSSIWSPVTVRVTPNEKTKVVMIGVLAGGTGTVSVDSIHARVRARPSKPVAGGGGRKVLGPGLYRAEGRYLVAASKDKASVRVLIPVPILWRDQVPLDFRAWTEPGGHVARVRLKKTGHGFHYAEVMLTNLPRGQDLRFEWAGNVLVLPHRASPVPKDVSLPLGDVPGDVKPWLVPTWCCDWKDPEIGKVAAEIREAGSTADVVVPATLRRMKAIFGSSKGRVTNLTASQALTRRGSCTSCANLGAALLRANGIPARIIAGYPTWSGPLQTHYVVEYWLPDGGWRLLESTLCRDDRPGWEQIEVAMVRPGDEAEDRAGRRVSAAGGVPYLSLTEYPDAKGKPFALVRLIGDMPERKYSDHRAVAVIVLEASDAEWAAAAKTLSARWTALTQAAVEKPAAIAGLAPRPGTTDAKSLPDLLESLR